MAGLRNVPARPASARTPPPINIQIARSVGSPVKRLEMSEPMELLALMPKMTSAIPLTNRMREMSFVMRYGFGNGTDASLSGNAGLR